MVRVTIEMPKDTFSEMDPDQFAGEMRLAAAVKWYELKKLSQGRAAEIAGISRREFIDALGRFGVSPYQYDVAELIEEVNRG
ncbi:MAG: UPF0175 family protein [Bacteroidetes bacterium]|nr:UPF0175 family protein [Bacteroidota bacterium]